MRSVIFIAKILSPSVIKRLIIVWILILGVSAGLSMALGLIKSIRNTQRYYANDDMRSLAYYVDTVKMGCDDPEQLALMTQTANDQLRTLPNIQAIYEQTTLYCPDEEMLCVAYPSPLIELMHIPADKHGEEVSVSDYQGSPQPIWLDYRMKDQYSINEHVSFEMRGMNNKGVYDFVVAGFLNGDNAHYSLQNGGSSNSQSNNVISTHPDYYVCVTNSESYFEGQEYDADRSIAKFLLPLSPSDIEIWKTRARKQGLGSISSMDDILRNDLEQIDSMVRPAMVLSAVLTLFTVFGLIGSQFQLMSLHRYIAFSLSLTGMDFQSWRYTWLLVIGIPLVIMSALGCVLGNIRGATIHLDVIRFWNIESTIITLSVFSIVILSMLPTIGRWSQLHVTQLRRIGE
jgi:hypothetical protein